VKKKFLSFKNPTEMNSPGKEMYSWIKFLFPIHRSLGGKGNIQTLNFFKKINNNLIIKKFKSGKKVFDWVVPDVWELERSYLKHSSGKIFADSKINNLHVVQYSIPMKKKIEKKELLKKIYSLPSQPNLIPYVTSYYKKDWGFCMKHSQKKKLPNGIYQAVIQSKFIKSGLNYGELFIKGKSQKEIFFSTYICHPSMANNELSGPTVMIKLSKYIKENFKNNYFSYRFIFIPETIGSIAYIQKNLKRLKKNVYAAFNITCVGDNRNISLVRSPRGNSLSDMAIESLLITEKNKKIYNFKYRGSDERQFNSPLVDLNMSVFCRTKFGEFDEYHTSGDNLKFISPQGLEKSFIKLKSLVKAFENGIFIKVRHKCEPFLTKYDLYDTLSFKVNYRNKQNKKLLDTLAHADGNKNIFELCKLLNIKIEDMLIVLEKLKKNKLINCKFINGSF